jgi:hypothetical protein
MLELRLVKNHLSLNQSQVFGPHKVENGRPSMFEAAEQGLAVLEEAEKGNPKAIEAMDELDRNEVSVAEAYREVFFVRFLNAGRTRVSCEKSTPALSYFCTALWRFARI